MYLKIFGGDLLKLESRKIHVKDIKLGDKTSFKDGVLEVTVPKNEEKKSKSINID